MLQRVHISIQGVVQGVGFRPFVYRLATELQLVGWISNSAEGVVIEVEGEHEKLDLFLQRLSTERPPQSYFQAVESTFLDPSHFGEFSIRESSMNGEKRALVLPDLALCPECLAEMVDPGNRRYLYPFINCTNCGPRYSIIESIPYDRSRTTMKSFEMCNQCKLEYDNAADRRFHAQPNACPRCGPQVECWSDEGFRIASHHQAIEFAARMIREGRIVAVKGLGGFHLMADARNENAVRELRSRKHREEKPLAVMFPDLVSLRYECEVSELEERLLKSAASPILLLEKSRPYKSALARSIAPDNPNLGAMLPYTGLHFLLLRELEFPVVATSGNLADEPICTDENEAVKRLQGIADVFLVHNRPILRHVDDSIVRVILGQEQILRRARGYAPLPIEMQSQSSPRTILAVGAHQKNAVAFAKGKNTFVSQHIGDLETTQAFDAFVNVVKSVPRLFESNPDVIVADDHPDYLSTEYARNSGLERIYVQHHFAHVLSCMAENQLTDSVLGVSWDGTGLGTDKTIWGGEFLLPTDSSFERIATIRSFGLPGGSKSVKEPRRIALGVLYQILGDALFDHFDIPSVAAFSESNLAIVRQMLEKNINCPVTTSVGRLFDAAASIVDLRQKVSFEGQAAMMLEFSIDHYHSDEAYDFEVFENSGRTTDKQSSPQFIIDWIPTFEQLLDDVRGRVPVAVMAAKFHNTLAEMIVELAGRSQCEKIVLTGGCFQNRYLTERTVNRLAQNGFHPYWHQRVPPNDGGISLGQVEAALRVHRTASQARLSEEKRKQEESVSRAD